MKKCFTLFLLSFILINQSIAQDWELAYEHAWDTRDIKVINDTLYFTRNVPTGSTTYVNYLYRSVTPGVILDSSKTIDGVYGCDNYDRHKGNEYIISYTPFAAQNGFRKKNQSNGQWIRKSAKGNYLLDKINDKVYISDRYTIEVSEDAGETFSHFWSTTGTISLVGFDKNNDMYVSLKTADTDSVGLWKVSDNGQIRTRVWATTSVFPHTGALVQGTENRIYVYDESNKIAYTDDGTNWTLVTIPSSTFDYGGYFASSIFQLKSGELIISLTTYQGGTGKTELVYKADADVNNFTLYSNGIPQTTQFHSLTYWKGYLYAKSLKGMYRMSIDGGTTNLFAKSGNNIHLNIYPNPASDVLKVTSGESIVGKTYVVTDCAGRSIEQGIITNELFELRLNNLHPGLYQLKVGEATAEPFILMR
jgi:hypothetical protein